MRFYTQAPRRRASLDPDDADNILRVKMCIANCYKALNRIDEGLNLERSNYDEAKAIWGASHPDTLLAALNLGAALSVLRLQQFSRDICATRAHADAVTSLGDKVHCE